MKNLQKRFAIQLPLLIILTVTLVSFGVFVYLTKVAELKSLPIGQSAQNQNLQPKIQVLDQTLTTVQKNNKTIGQGVIDDSDWKIYRNDFFEMKYPADYKAAGEKSEIGEIYYENMNGEPEIFITRGENKLVFQDTWAVISLDATGPVGHGNKALLGDDVSINGIKFKKKYRVIRNAGNGDWLTAIVYYGCNKSDDCFSILRGIVAKGISASTLTKEEEDRDIRWYGVIMPDEKQTQEILKKMKESQEVEIFDQIVSTFNFIGMRNDLKAQYNAKGVGTYIPDGWVIIAQAEGDLNNDGLSDMAIVIEDHTDESKLYFGDTGKGVCLYSEICPRRLIILTKDGGGFYKLGLGSDKAILNNGDYMYVTYISDSNNLVKINDNYLVIEFMDGGSFVGATKNIYRFIYQNNGWYLVARDDVHAMTRGELNNGENSFCPSDAFVNYEKYDYSKGTVEKFTGPLVNEAYATNGDYQCTETDKYKTGVKNFSPIEKKELVNLSDFDPRIKNK